MKHILIAAMVAAVALAGCTADDRESTNGGNGNAEPGDGAQQVDGTIDVVENTNDSTEGNVTTTETETNSTGANETNETSG